MSGSPAARRSSRARRARVSGRMKRTTTTTKHGVRSPWGQRCTTNSENTPRTTRTAGACRDRRAASTRMQRTAASPKTPQRVRRAPALHARMFPRGTTMPRQASALQDAPSPAPRPEWEGAPPTRDAFPSKAATASATARRGPLQRSRPLYAHRAETRTPRPAACGRARRRWLGGRCHHRRGAVRAEPARQRHAERGERRSARRQDARRRPVRQRHQAPTGRPAGRGRQRAGGRQGGAVRRHGERREGHRA